MNRIGIYCLYTPSGILDFATLKTLKDLRTAVRYLILVVNGNINQKSELIDYADEILIRKNAGLDIGAYAEVLLSPDYMDRIKESDELVLCNSSFYGPFLPFCKIFEKMKGSGADFWGLSSSEKNLVQHLQSYFLVFRRRILEGGELFEYLRERVNVKKMDYFGACSVFENGLFWMLKNVGYQFDAYKRNIDCDNYSNPYGSVKIDGLPVLKKKIFSPKFYQKQQAVNALSYVRATYGYDIAPILEHAAQAYGVNLKNDEIGLEQRESPGKDVFWEPGICGREEIERFIAENKRVFIYGNGIMAKRVFSCFFFYEKNPALEGFVVSDGQEVREQSFRGYPVYRYSELKNKRDTAFLVALNRKNTGEVFPLLKDVPRIKFLWRIFEVGNE